MVVDGLTLWLIAAGLYAVDAARQVPSGAHVMLQVSPSSVTAGLIEPSFRVGSRSIRVPNLLRPDITEYTLAAASAKPSLSVIDELTLQAMPSLLRPAAIASASSGFILFGLVPLLTNTLSLIWSLAVGLLLMHSVMAISFLMLWRRRRLLGLSGQTLRDAFFHYAMCPPNALNTARRLAGDRRLRFAERPMLAAYGSLDMEAFNMLRGEQDEL